jgi:hypothetical protein
MRRTVGKITEVVGAPSVAAVAMFAVWAVGFFAACAANQDCKTMPRSAVKGMKLGSDFQDASIGLYAMAAILASAATSAAVKGVGALRNHVRGNTAQADERTHLLDGNGSIRELKTDTDSSVGDRPEVDSSSDFTAVQIQGPVNTAAVVAKQEEQAAAISIQRLFRTKKNKPNNAPVSADVAASSSEQQAPRPTSR